MKQWEKKWSIKDISYKNRYTEFNKHTTNGLRLDFWLVLLCLVHLLRVENILSYTCYTITQIQLIVFPKQSLGTYFLLCFFLLLFFFFHLTAVLINVFQLHYSGLYFNELFLLHS